MVLGLYTRRVREKSEECTEDESKRDAEPGKEDETETVQCDAREMRGMRGRRGRMRSIKEIKEKSMGVLLTDYVQNDQGPTRRRRKHSSELRADPR